MFFRLLCFCLSWCSLVQAEHLPELIFRPQTALEAFSFVQFLSGRLPWFKEKGYKVTLPNHPRFGLLYQNPKALSEGEMNELQEIFITQIYNVSSFDLGLTNLRKSEPIVKRGLDKLTLLQKNWGFQLKERYEIVLTLYGPGGDSDYKKGKITVLTTPEGNFRRKNGYETLLHEIVHMGIEEKIVQKYQLSHWEKERLVDLICFYYLREMLPEYQKQPIKDTKIDDFVDEYSIIHDLPWAIKRFVHAHPR